MLKELLQLEEYVNFIISDIQGLSEYDYIKYIPAIERVIMEDKSLLTAIAYENCICFSISPIYIYLLHHLVDDVSLLLIYECCHLFTLGLILESDLREILINILNKDIDINDLTKNIANKLGFVFAKKSLKKNSLFKLCDNVYKLSPFPILDSTTSLSKEACSKNYLISDLCNSKINRLSECTLVCLVLKLKSSKSSEVILSTLKRFFVLCDSDLDITRVLMSIPRDKIVNTPRVRLLANELLDDLEKCLVLHVPVLPKIIKIINSI